MRSRPVLAAVLSLFAGCGVAHPSVAPCGTIELDAANIRLFDGIDLLFVVDGSRSMAAERMQLVTEIPRTVRALATGDRDGDGIEDVDPVDLHVGVITADLGAAGGAAFGCGEGDDGVLVRLSASSPSCPAERPSGIFEFAAGVDDPAALAEEVGCAALANVDQCGVEQPLEAALRALSVSTASPWTAADYEPPTFGDGSSGQGDRANAGFLRPTSLLAVVVLTDEDDCSVSDAGAELSGISVTEQDPECSGAGGLLALERFTAGLIGLRPDPSSVTFHLVAGVPQSLVDAEAGFEVVLATPEMQPSPDPASPGHLLPSCTGRNGAQATPPRRLVQTAQALATLGAGTSMTSICNDALTGPAGWILERMSHRFASVCMPRPLELDADGRPDANVDVILPPAESRHAVTRCDQVEGATARPSVPGEWDGHPVTREVCRLRALTRDEVARGERGWFYDDGDPRLGDASALVPGGCPQAVNVSRIVSFDCTLRVEYGTETTDRALCDD